MESPYLDSPMCMCTCVSEEGGGGESEDSEALSLLSYTIKYISLTYVDIGVDGEGAVSEALSDYLYCHTQLNTSVSPT
jgi:hypothetical protein